MHTKFRSENLKRRDHSDDLGVGGMLILEWILEEYGGNICIDFICLGIGNIGEIIFTW
jgi:hypothetical protein